MYGSRFALLAHATEELGLGDMRDGVQLPHQRSLPVPSGLTESDLSLYAIDAQAAATAGLDKRSSVQLPAPLSTTASAQGEGVSPEPRTTVNIGVRKEEASGEVYISIDT